jgi:glycosyltransferase involved in cell wall biosynthesis
MRVLINGLGCPFTGAKFVLDEILTALPPDIQATAIVPVVDGAGVTAYPDNIKVIKLKHRYWGMYLRIFAELYVNIVMWLKRYDLMVNLSNYGLCFTRKQVLYIHNPYILDMSAATAFGEGRPNFLIRSALNTFIRKGESIYLQTEHMYEQLREYCEANQLKFPRAKILRPPFPVIPRIPQAPKKTFPFQFFYPASPFAHKRTDLAVDAVLLARKVNGNTGLHITIDAPPRKVEGVTFLGLIKREEVYTQFAASDAMLFTSERETLGLPLLEAMFFGKPAVLPDLPYAREIYGDAGAYYKQNTSQAISEAILDVMNKYDDYVKKVRARKEVRLATEITWKGHWDEFLAVAGAASSPGL